MWEGTFLRSYGALTRAFSLSVHRSIPLQRQPENTLVPRTVPPCHMVPVTLDTAEGLRVL